MSDQYKDQYNDDDDDDEYDDDQPGMPWPPPVQPPYPEPPGRSRTSKIILLTLTAAVAAAGGYFVVTAIRDVSANPATASATPSTTPSSPAQGGLPTTGSGNGGGALPIPSTGPGETLHLEIGGRVSAVSPTSITLSGQGQSVTAAVTKSTTITGKVHAISGIKAGDLVSAQITSTDGKLTATAIQDPASIP